MHNVECVEFQYSVVYRKEKEMYQVLIITNNYVHNTEARLKEDNACAINSKYRKLHAINKNVYTLPLLVIVAGCAN